jgi:hypothetical protein
MCFYDGGLGYSAYRGLINPDTGAPYRNYYSFTMFNSLYKLGNQVQAISEDKNVFVGAAANGKKASVILTNLNEDEVTIDLDLANFEYSEVMVIRNDKKTRHTLTGETIDSGTIKIPANGSVEIKFWNI